MSAAQGIAGLGELGSLLGIDLLNPRSETWMIIDAKGYAKQAIVPVLVPDTVVRFEYRNESRVCDYPIEQGAFSSYNKVSMPYDLRMLMACAGYNYAQEALKPLIQDVNQGTFGRRPMRQEDFLSTLDYMLSATDLFEVVTPDRTYLNMSLVHYDFKREASNGARLLLVEAFFREIRVSGSATYTAVQSHSPSAASPAALGTVQTLPLGDQAASIGPFQ